MHKMPKYEGINNEELGGMSAISKIIRDAWVFEILPESETCEGWEHGRINDLKEKVNVEWDKYGCMVSQLPKELLERHQRIYGEAIARAKEAGWSGEHEIEGDS
jgi:hypothetical protein